MLSLYYRTYCQYCHKVIYFAERNGIGLELRDIYADPAAMDELLDRGGKRQVPYLVDTEKKIEMYESDDIVEYLSTHYAHQS